MAGDGAGAQRYIVRRRSRRPSLPPIAASLLAMSTQAHDVARHQRFVQQANAE